MSNLLVELLLRLLKPTAAALIGALIYWVATGLLGEPGSVSLALLSWLSGAAAVLLVETNIL